MSVGVSGAGADRFRGRAQADGLSLHYIPGLLSFREAPAAIEALERLRTTPDVVLYDGHGVAHPRRCGIASHVGLLADVPSIGVAKTLFVGSFAEPGHDRGAWSPLVDRDEVIGAALRTRPGVRPIFVSIGHRIGLERAIDVVIECVTRYRLPETTRWAHRVASVPGGVDAARRAIAARGV